MDTKAVQTHYWSQFSRLKRDAVYISRYHARVEVIDRNINMLAAIASSAAIGGWAIWQSLGPLWACVIAASQVLTAIKPFLPFKARLKALAQFGGDLDALALVAETDWLKVSKLAVTDDEIYAMSMTLKRKCLAAQQRAFNGASLPEDQRWVDAAEAEAQSYLDNYASLES